MADSPKSIARRKWGRFLPHQRANVDQVPLPFVNDMDMEVTYEQKGAKRVCINQNGPALGKRQATGQVCFRPEVPVLPEGADQATFKKYMMEQPAPCIIYPRHWYSYQRCGDCCLPGRAGCPLAAEGVGSRSSCCGRLKQAVES